MIQIDPAIGMSRQDIMNHLDNLVYNQRNYLSTNTPAGLAIGTSSTAAVKQVNAIKYRAAGAIYSKGAANEVAFTATTMNIPANASSVQEALFVICINAAGTLSIVMGAIATGSGNALLPERSTIPDGVCPLGTVRIAVAAGSTNFVAGTTALSHGALTVTYTDGVVFAPLFATAQ
jgi:hypothetical protein